MDAVLEIVFEILAEIGAELVASKQKPKVFKPLLAAFLAILYLAVIFIMLIMAVAMFESNIKISVFLIASALLLIIPAVLKIYKCYRKTKNKSSQ